MQVLIFRGPSTKVRPNEFYWWKVQEKEKNYSQNKVHDT